MGIPVCVCVCTCVYVYICMCMRACAPAPMCNSLETTSGRVFYFLFVFSRSPCLAICLVQLPAGSPPPPHFCNASPSFLCPVPVLESSEPVPYMLTQKKKHSCSGDRAPHSVSPRRLRVALAHTQAWLQRFRTPPLWLHRGLAPGTLDLWRCQRTLWAWCITPRLCCDLLCCDLFDFGENRRIVCCDLLRILSVSMRLRLGCDLSFDFACSARTVKNMCT
jgi:hypothetical protein